MRRLLVVLCVACLSLTADGRYHEDFHYGYAQSSGGRLSVENFNGSVEISGWDQNSVDVSGTKYADSETRLHDVRIDISNESNGVQIRTLRPDRQPDASAAGSVRRPVLRLSLCNNEILSY